MILCLSHLSLFAIRIQFFFLVYCFFDIAKIDAALYGKQLQVLTVSI